LKKNPQDEQTPRLIADLMAVLKPGWYSLYWLQRKIARPFENLKRKLGQAWLSFSKVCFPKTQRPA
jgi:hypothetical protein